MRRRRLALVAAVALLPLATTLRTARADDPVPVRVDYQAHAGCPSTEAFTQEVLGRVSRARAATPGEQARTLVVRVRAAGAGLEASLAIRELDGTVAERTVRGDRCPDLVTALAVIASVALDPVTREPAPDAAPDAAPPPPPPAPPVDEARAPEPARARSTVSAGAGVGLAGGAAPVVLPGVLAFVEVSSERDGLLDPSARLRFGRTAVGGRAEGGPGARFGLTTGSADLCPIALEGWRLRASPCVRVEVGVLNARGSGVEPTHTEARPWFVLGPVARVRLDLTGPLFAELEGAVLAVVVRDRFLVDSTLQVYRPPPVAGAAGFALGLAF